MLPPLLLLLVVVVATDLGLEELPDLIMTDAMPRLPSSPVSLVSTEAADTDGLLIDRRERASHRRVEDSEGPLGSARRDEDPVVAPESPRLASAAAGSCVEETTAGVAMTASAAQTLSPVAVRAVA